ncbi:unnamed protein product [Parascedosporium putredinis]|uniref:Uncharacterized protein n=1 Tax=Parascedosporium putredinis TaxID=1442378 RepID=A0A9P1HCV5_9PEZI|nr:unnamed protein product [Parascedosporium putredinis]CAI8005045.1 unnamed protein product [Parascedosporium putredinis]
MKFSIYALVVGAAFAAATPLDMIDEIEASGEIPPLLWTGQIEIGGDNVTLTGSAESLNCNVGGGAEPLWILNGISYLYGLGNGGCRAPAGWGGCSRTSCSYNAAIWLCNDRTVPVTIPCKYVADNAAGIHEKCKHWVYDPPAPRRTNGEYDYYTNGQIFSFDKTWNVIVKSTNC